jgi:acetyl-CoA carboxylase carboxyltransferase component
MTERSELIELHNRLSKTLDEERGAAREKRYEKGYRTARENLDDLLDKDTFIEYGQLAIAAQKSRRELEELRTETAADGIITGFGKVNSEILDDEKALSAVIINDYSVLAGTQGYYHHKKLDRICETAEKQNLPVIMYTEGGGGRPGDTDVHVQFAGLQIPSFSNWAKLKGKNLRIAVNNGYCFAGNAALFGTADFCISTKNSWLGMAGPAMIEGGGLGKVNPKDIGPAEEQEKLGVIDYLAEDEADATSFAKKLLSYFQGNLNKWETKDQSILRNLIPENRRMAYSVRDIIETIADKDSFLEVRKIYGRSVITGFMRLEGKPVALIANDCQHLGGAVDATSAEKAGQFISICNDHNLPIVSLADTPGFMVGVDSEREGAVRKMGSLFNAGANISVPLVAIFLRKGYGLGAMAMVGGSFYIPIFTASWPTGEFGGMGLEGAVKLGYKKELEAIEDEKEREELFNKLVQKMYDAGKALEAATQLEIDAVIDPADTRSIILKALETC